MLRSVERVRKRKNKICYITVNKQSITILLSLEYRRVAIKYVEFGNECNKRRCYNGKYIA